jgi:hypothetical protein
MIECICIDDSARPTAIPENKWVKKDEKYHVIYTVTVLPQKQLAFHLAEIDLDESCTPFTYFLARRFAFTLDNLKLLMELIKDCSDTDFSMDELIKETQLQEL